MWKGDCAGGKKIGIVKWFVVAILPLHSRKTQKDV